MDLSAIVVNKTVKILGGSDFQRTFYTYVPNVIKHSYGVFPTEVTAEDVFHLVEHNYDKHCQNTCAIDKLICAVASFGEKGCCAQEAHSVAFDTPYESNAHPFANIGLFVEPVPMRNDYHRNNKIAYALVDTRELMSAHNISLYGDITKPFVMVERVSRNCKQKYRLSEIGKRMLKKFEENSKFCEISTLTKDMLADPDGIAHFMVTETLKGNPPADYKGILHKVNVALEDPIVNTRFGRNLKTLRKKLHEVVC